MTVKTKGKVLFSKHFPDNNDITIQKYDWYHDDLFDIVGIKQIDILENGDELIVKIIILSEIDTYITYYINTHLGMSYIVDKTLRRKTYKHKITLLDLNEYVGQHLIDDPEVSAALISAFNKRIVAEGHNPIYPNENVLFHIIRYNFFRGMDLDGIDFRYDDYEVKSWYPKLLIKLRKKYMSGDYVNYLFNKSRPKSIRKMIATNRLVAPMYDFLRRIGFKDINVIRNLIKKNCNYVQFLMTALEDNYWCMRKIILDIDKDDTFKRRFLTRNDTYDAYDLHIMFYDTMRMYVSNRGIPEDIRKEMLKKSKSISELHDLLAEEASRIEDEKNELYKTTIQYPENINDLNQESDGEVSFEVLDTGLKIKKAGRTFRNCVGSYVDNVYEKRSIIVIQKDISGPSVCIELNGNATQALQALGKHNRKLNKVQEQYFIKWCDKHHISYDYCYGLVIDEPATHNPALDNADIDNLPFY